MATYQILYWHDIPLPVRLRGADGRVRVPLPDRFQEAMDLAAMEAGLIGADDYTSQLRWSAAEERAGESREVAEAVAAELDARYAKIDWRATAEALKPKI